MDWLPASGPLTINGPGGLHAPWRRERDGSILTSRRPLPCRLGDSRRVALVEKKVCLVSGPISRPRQFTGACHPLLRVDSLSSPKHDGSRGAPVDGLAEQEGER